MLIYGSALDRSDDEALARMRGILPDACYANHLLGNGEYVRLDAQKVSGLLAHARVGLCLSAVEGHMRASIEYLLCGLPVVSTPSIGGRDRYYVREYCQVVDADPDAVAGAVRRLAEADLDRTRIRSHVGEMIAFDRYNFLLNVNKIARRYFEIDNLIPEFEPFLGLNKRYRPFAQNLTDLRDVHKSSSIHDPMPIARPSCPDT